MSSVECARIREIWNHVYEKQRTSDLVCQFLKLGNAQIKSVQNNSWTRRGTTYGPYARVDIANIACVVGVRYWEGNRDFWRVSRPNSLLHPFRTPATQAIANSKQQGKDNLVTR